MTTFDFDTIVDRRGTSSLKWDRYQGRDIIPLWVADMDFRAPLPVIEALHERVSHGVFGYGLPPSELTETVIEMMEMSHGWQVDKEWIIWLPGLVTGINAVCRTVGQSGDAVATLTPVYPPFLSAPANSDRELVTVPLAETETRWEIDFDRLQEMLTPRTRLFLHCNPQNPTGRVFGRAEQERLAQICEERDIIICSDDIHNGLILDERCDYLPLASIDKRISNRTITLMAPSKTFNLPGFGCSFAIIENPVLRKRFQEVTAGIVPHGNVLGYTAALAAYQKGGLWQQALLGYLRKNHDLLQREIGEIIGLQMKPAQATYLAWIDIRETGQIKPEPFFEEAGVGILDGGHFGGSGWVRLNFACPRITLQTAIRRIKSALNE